MAVYNNYLLLMWCRSSQLILLVQGQKDLFQVVYFSRSVFTPRWLETRETNKTYRSILFCSNLGLSHESMQECASCFYAGNQNKSSAFVAILRRSRPHFLPVHIALIASQTAKIGFIFTATDTVILVLSKGPFRPSEARS